MAKVKVSEEDFRQQITQLGKLTGWMIYHTYDSRRSEPGFPDLVLVKRPRIIFAELKSEKGKTTEAQEAWIRELTNCYKVQVGLWRPSDFDFIERTLKRPI